MRRQRRHRSGAVPLLVVIPWWLWLVLAAVSFAIFHWMANLPRTGSGPALLARSLNIGLGYAGRLIIPAPCLLAALIAFVAQHRRPREADASTVTEVGQHATVAEPQRHTTVRVEGDLYSMWKSSSPAERNAAPDTSRWSLELLRALEWKRLEQLCALYFRTLRFRVVESAPGPDGGIDLRLFVGSEQRADVLVQCKAWNTWKVGVKEIRELFGVMASEGVNEGIFVTTSTFSFDAVDFARGKSIALIDGDDLLRKLKDLPDADKEHILKLATAGDFTTPTCASCGNKMIERTAKDSGKRFWGCPSFPACRTTLPMSNSRSTPG